MLNLADEIADLSVPKYNYWNEALHGVMAINTTVFPEPIGLGASFNMSLIHAMGIVISTEARAVHNLGHPSSIVFSGGLTFFAPNINIFRDPRWGRGQETPGEDPYLTSQYAVTYITAMQGSPDDPFYDANVRKLTACAKHAFAYSLDNWEGINRYDFNAIVDPIDFEETYLPAFKAAVTLANVSTVMCSYNSINGTPSCAHGDLFNTMVRDQWGFNGYVVSDCDAIKNIYTTHHYTSTPDQAAADALNAGVDLDCGEFYKNLQGAVDSGLVNESLVTTAVERLFVQRFSLGMFDSPTSSYDAINSTQLSSAPHTALALDAARQSIVLLRNNNSILPLDRSTFRQIAVIGPNANDALMQLGNYNGWPKAIVTPLQALIDEGMDVKYVMGCTIGSNSTHEFDDAIQLAKNSDVVLLFLGLDQTQEREMHDRVSLSLPGVQMELAQELVMLDTPVILIMMNGGPVDITWLRDNADAVLEAFYPGEQGGQAIVDVLFGDYNPGGRLPYTVYPADYVNQINMTEMSMRAGPGRGYRFYTGTPVFSFGEGLSYTTFSYANISIANSTMGQTQELWYSQLFIDGVASLEINVTNTGRMAGSDVVLAFISNNNMRPFYLPAPIKELFGFTRIFLEPGQSQTVSFDLPEKKLFQFASESATHAYLCGGDYTITIGAGEHAVRVPFSLALGGQDCSIRDTDFTPH